MIGTNEAFLKSIRDVVIEAEERTKKADKSWMHIGQTVEEISRKFETGWSASFSKQFGKQGPILGALDKLSTFLKDPVAGKAMLAGMKTDQKAIQGEIQKLTDLKKLIGLKPVEAIKLKDLKAIDKSLDQQIKMTSSLVKLRVEEMVWLPAILGSIKGAAEWTDKMQAALISTNANLKARYQLMTDINQVQRSTGASTETMAEATQAATKYAMQMGPSFRDNMDIIVKMKEGLGVSTENSAMLLATMNRMGTSSLAVADAIARIKATSGLAADEAARLATELTRAMKVIAPGGDVIGVVEKIGRLEGAAVKLGFSAGEMTKFTTGLTKQSGLMGLGMLGLQPDFIKDQSTAMLAFQRAVEFTEVQLKAAGTNAYARQAVLQQMSEIFNTTTDVLASGRDILKEYNKQQGTATTLQQEWQQQTSTFAKSWDKLKNQFGALIHGALLPLVKVLQYVVDGFTSCTTWILQTKGALWGMVLALTAATAATIYQSKALLKNFSPVQLEFTKLLPKARSFTSLIGRLGTYLSLAGGPMTILLKLFGAVGLAGSLGWTVGRLIASNTKIDKTMEKMFTALLTPTIHGIAGTSDPLAKGAMTQGDWKARVMSMRNRGYGEDVVGKWAQSHIKDISELKTVSEQYGLQRLAASAKGLQDWLIESGEARQSLKMFQTTTQTSQGVYEETMKQTKILEAIQAAAEIQATAAKEGKEAFQKVEEQRSIEAQRLRDDAAMERMSMRSPGMSRGAL